MAISWEDRCVKGGTYQTLTNLVIDNYLMFLR